MRIRILGAAAGGGVPQWNCRCANCEAARVPGSSVRPRTQSSVAISADGHAWFLLNISPDVRQQILAFSPLGPGASGERGQGIAGCVLTDAELDHTAGLLFLREGGPFKVFCTPLVHRWLNRYMPIEPLLASFARPTWVELPLETPVPLTGDLMVRAFEVDRHFPRFVTENDNPKGSVIGLDVHDRKTGGKLVYAPCVGSLDGPLLTWAKEADAVLIDGTFWSNEEPLRFSSRTALEMGHAPVSGPEGSLSWLADLPGRHRMYVHINNTNPMLNEAGPEYRMVASNGVRVGADGDMFDL